MFPLAPRPRLLVLHSRDTESVRSGNILRRPKITFLPTPRTITSPDVFAFPHTCTLYARMHEGGVRERFTRPRGMHECVMPVDSDFHPRCRQKEKERISRVSPAPALCSSRPPLPRAGRWGSHERTLVAHLRLAHNRTLR